MEMTETALRNKGELNSIPGTSEYGNRRTGAVGIRTSKKTMRTVKIMKKTNDAPRSMSIGTSWVTTDIYRSVKLIK